MTASGPPNGWPYHPWHRLVRRRRPLGAEVAAAQAGCRAWVHVAPADLGPLGGGYQLTYYEVEAAEDERAQGRVAAAGRQLDPAEVTLLNVQALVAFDEEELRELLSFWLDDLERLGDPALDGSPVRLRGAEELGPRCR